MVPVSGFAPWALWWLETYRLPGIIGMFGPDVVAGLGNRGLLRPRCPQVVLVQDAHLFYPIKLSLGGHYRKWRLKRSLHSAQLVLCQTEVARRRFLEAFGYHGETAVFPNAVSRVVSTAESDAPELPMPAPMQAYRHKKRLLCLTRYYPHKNPEILLETFSRHRKQLSDVVVFTTVSSEDGKQRGVARFLERIRAPDMADSIVNVGTLPQESLAAYYRHCQAVIVPTVLESFSATYLEAMHFGVPILTSDLDFARGICGEAAVYFDPRNAESVAAAVRRLLDDPALSTALAARGRQRLGVLSRSWDDLAATLAGMLERVATGSATADKWGGACDSRRTGGTQAGDRGQAMLPPSDDGPSGRARRTRSEWR